MNLRSSVCKEFALPLISSSYQPNKKQLLTHTAAFTPWVEKKVVLFAVHMRKLTKCDRRDPQHLPQRQRGTKTKI